jgi:hypothetical protein
VDEEECEAIGLRGRVGRLEEFKEMMRILVVIFDFVAAKLLSSWRLLSWR